MVAKVKKNLKIVCLGGGIGTVNLLRGIKEYSKNITVVVSMADDGGSAGRLRRLYSIPPPGDLINCIAAMSNVDSQMRDLLTYRFSGNRYDKDYTLPGQKLGNLILVALTRLTGSFDKALDTIQGIFKTSGRIFPSTKENIAIWAKTSTGENVYREENIDLGKFRGKIEKLHLFPTRPTAPAEVKESIKKADVIIAGPGDLYTTVLPVLLVPGILEEIKKSKARKIFVINVANKPFETPDYKIKDYINAIISHCGSPLFDYFIVNENFRNPIPKKFKDQYHYVKLNGVRVRKNQYKIIKADIIDEKFPLYHDSKKLAKNLLKMV